MARGEALAWAAIVLRRSDQHGMTGAAATCCKGLRAARGNRFDSAVNQDIETSSVAGSCGLCLRYLF